MLSLWPYRVGHMFTPPPTSLPMYSYTDQFVFCQGFQCMTCAMIQKHEAMLDIWMGYATMHCAFVSSSTGFFFFFTFSWMEHGPITLIKLPYFQQTAYRLNFHFVHAFFSTVWHWLALSSDVWLGHNLYCINYNKTLAWCAAPKHTSDNKLGQVCLVPDWHCVGKFKIQVGN